MYQIISPIFLSHYTELANPFFSYLFILHYDIFTVSQNMLAKKLEYFPKYPLPFCVKQVQDLSVMLFLSHHAPQTHRGDWY